MEDEDPPETVLCRANDLRVNGGIRSYYDLANNNCFHFAFFCKTGRSYGSRIEELLFREKKRVACFPPQFLPQFLHETSAPYVQSYSHTALPWHIFLPT
jgi:hypothetical protein